MTPRNSDARRTAAAFLLVAAALAGCKSSGQTADAATDGADDSGEVGLPQCPDPPAASDMAAADDFGPDAKAVAMPTALGRINVYEVTSPRLLERVDIFLRADLTGSRVTLAVFEAPSKDKAFNKVTDVQVDVPSCQGWASSGPLTVALRPGFFYAIGFDPNQPLTTFVNADSSNIPVDGHFGRLIGSKTVTSVSVPTQIWDKVADKDFMRQRLLTSPREQDDAGDDAGAVDDDGGAAGDALQDASNTKDALDAIGS